MDLLDRLKAQNLDLYKKQYGLIRGISLAATADTMSLAFTWITLDLFRNDPNIKLTKSQEADMVSCIPAGAIMGSLFAIIILDIFGRRNTLILAPVLSSLTWYVMSIAKDAELVLIIRHIQGILLGLQSTATTVYAGEIVLKNYRSLAHIGRTSSGGAGVLLLVFVRYFYGHDWRILANVMIGISVLAGFNFVTYPCSPYRMYKKYGRDHCMASLIKIFDNQNACERQFRALRNICNVQEPRLVKMVDVFKNSVDNYFGLYLIIMQQLTGIFLIIFKSEDLFRIHEKFDPITCVMVVGSVNAAIYMFSAVDHSYNRKRAIWNTFLKISNGLLIIWFYFATGDAFSVLFTIFDDSFPFRSFIQSIYSTDGALAAMVDAFVIVFVLVFLWAFNTGWGKVSEDYLVESLGVVKKEVACGVINAAKWAIAYILCVSFPYLIHTIRYGCVFLFLLICYLAVFSLGARSIPEINDRYVNALC